MSIEVRSLCADAGSPAPTIDPVILGGWPAATAGLRSERQPRAMDGDRGGAQGLNSGNGSRIGGLAGWARRIRRRLRGRHVGDPAVDPAGHPDAGPAGRPDAGPADGPPALLAGQPAAGPAATMLPASPRYSTGSSGRPLPPDARPVRYVCWPWPRPSGGSDPRAGPGSRQRASSRLFVVNLLGNHTQSYILLCTLRYDEQKHGTNGVKLTTANRVDSQQ
jgi:hypothetical protein